MGMAALLRRVRDAERMRALAVLVVFDFHDAEPFVLEDTEAEGGECQIPALMVGKADGDRLKAQFTQYGEAPIHVFQRVDSVMHKVRVAQEAGAFSVIVAQNKENGRPIQLKDDTAESGADTLGALASDAAIDVTIPVCMVSYQDGEDLKAHLRKPLNLDGCPLQLEVKPTGDVYAWGYGEEGRLGLGDTDNDQIFEAGYDATTDISYQFVARPLFIPTLAGLEVVQVACGDEHSASLTVHGEVHTWGSGDDGRLGHGDEDEEYVPRIVEKLKGKRVVSIVCGDEHTMAVTRPFVDYNDDDYADGDGGDQ